MALACWAIHAHESNPGGVIVYRVSGGVIIYGAWPNRSIWSRQYSNANVDIASQDFATHKTFVAKLN